MFKSTEPALLWNVNGCYWNTFNSCLL